MDSNNILSILAALGGPAASAAGEGVTSNVLQAIAPLAPVEAPVDPILQVAPPAPAPAAKTDERPKKRSSVIDTIGRLADVFATVGGAQALYQPTLDSREDRGMKIEDRAREIDMDALRKTLAEQQVEAGEQAPQDTMRARMAQALGAVAQNPDAATLWPQIAQEAGIDPQRAEAIGAMIAKNPDATGIFAQALGYEPSKQGSPTSAIQNYDRYQEILTEQGPEAAQQFLQVTSPQNFGISPYQQKRLNLDTQKLNWEKNPRNSRNRPKPVKPGTRDKAVASARASSNIVNRLGIIRGSVDKLDNMGAIVVPGETGANIVRRARSSAPGQFLESFAGTAAQEQRDLITQEANAIVAEMKEALKLTGTMMDRPQEYQRYINIINNPNTTKANMIHALDQLEKQFNSDMARGPTQSASGSSALDAELSRRGLKP